MGLMIDPKMRNFQEIIGFLTKIHAFTHSQHASKCVKNCSDY